MKKFILGLAFVSTVLAVIIYFLLPGLDLPKTKEVKETVFFIGMAFGAPLGWFLGFYVVGPWLGKTSGRRLFSVVSAILMMIVFMFVFPNDQIIKWIAIPAIAIGAVWVVFGGHKEGEDIKGSERVQMMVFDRSRSRMDVKVRKAVDQYSKDYGYSPNLVLCNPGEFDKKAKVSGVKIMTDKQIEKGSFWIGYSQGGMK